MKTEPKQENPEKKKEFFFLPFLKAMLDSSVLILKRTPSYLISDLEVKLIKLPMYESGDPAVEDLELSVEAMPF